jgi:hypothetical protein
MKPAAATGRTASPPPSKIIIAKPFSVRLFED